MSKYKTDCYFFNEDYVQGYTVKTCTYPSCPSYGVCDCEACTGENGHYVNRRTADAWVRQRMAVNKAMADIQVNVPKEIKTRGENE